LGDELHGSKWDRQLLKSRDDCQPKKRGIVVKLEGKSSIWATRSAKEKFGVGVNRTTKAVHPE